MLRMVIYASMKLLIIGGSGLIGSNIIDRAADFDVVV